MKTSALLTTEINGFAKIVGKVRDIYEVPEGLVIIATDRISAYDVVLPNGIPDKGRVLTEISAFWFEKFADLVPNHMISTNLPDLPEEFRADEIAGRFMLCKRADVVPIECVVRGYLAGSGWRDYKKNRTVCGVKLEEGLKQCEKLPEPIFTPTTKATDGHDESVTFSQACDMVGEETMKDLREKSIEVYTRGNEYASERGIVLADTKFEWGRDSDGNIMLIDEVLTPDSSRFWPAEEYKPGRNQPSFDKQFVRDYLDEIDFDRTPPGPVLPTEIVQKTREKYIEAFTLLTGKTFAWE